MFDDERAVANTGVMLPALLAQRLGIEQLVDDSVRLGDRPGAANAGRKVMTMVSAMALGAASVEDCDVLRSGRTTGLTPATRTTTIHAGTPASACRDVSTSDPPARQATPTPTASSRPSAPRTTTTIKRWTEA